MNRWMVRTYAAVVLLAILTAGTVHLVQLSNLRRDAAGAAAQDFRVLSRIVAQRWQEDRASDGVPATILEKPVLLVVASREHTTDYFWARSNSILNAASLPGGENGFTTTLPGALYVTFSRTFSMPDGSHRIVHAVYPVLPTPQFARLLRSALITALIIAGSAVVLAILLVLRGHHAGQFAAGPAAEHQQADPGMSPATPREVPQEPPRAVSQEPRQPAARDVPPEAQPQQKPPQVPEHPADPLRSTEDVLDILERQLENELDRAGFAEQDLAVAEFSFSNIPHSQAMLALRDFFPVGELCIAVPPDRAVVMIPNSTVIEALGIVERFQRFFWDKRQDWSSRDADFYCGVTARSARLVEPERILKECRGALQQARSNPGRIMGFHSDPKRYREFVASS